MHAHTHVVLLILVGKDMFLILLILTSIYFLKGRTVCHFEVVCCTHFKFLELQKHEVETEMTGQKPSPQHPF